MVSSFKYGPLDFAKNEIRLVTIAAGSPSDELKGNLFHTLLDTYSSASPDDRPGYDALSYCWGDATGIRDVDGNINIKGQLFQLTPNLEAAIRSLRSPINDSVIWIDAICINQYNNEERNEQVKKMRHIYHTAETVRIWLGESYSDSSSAFELLRELATLAVKKTSEAIIHQDTVFITQRLKHFDALCSLFERSYWERVWIVQEIVQAKTLTVHCGSDSISWSDILKATEILTQQLVSLSLSAGPDTAKVETLLFRGPSSLIKLQTAAHGEDNPTFSLEGLLMNHDNRQATDPRDRVYALVGISTAREDPDFVLDYSRSVQEVYISAVKHVLSFSGSLGIICSVHPGSTIPDLPSWVPDWTITVGTSKTRASVSERSPCVGAYLDADASISADGRKLTTKGFRIDSIEYHGKTWIRHPHSSLADLETFHAWRKQLITIKGTDIEHQRAFARSLVIYGGLEDKEMSEEMLLGAFGSLTMRLLPEQQIDPQLTEYTRLWRTTNPKTNSTEDSIKALEVGLVKMTALCALGRQLFISREGKIGTATNDVRGGDVICVLFGCSLPIVLRERENDGGYILVGEAFVDGMTDKGAIAGLEKKKYKVDEFQIW